MDKRLNKRRILARPTRFERVTYGLEERQFTNWQKRKRSQINDLQRSPSLVGCASGANFSLFPTIHVKIPSEFAGRRQRCTIALILLSGNFIVLFSTI
ncbi:hypothetical protein KDX20_22165 [Burkholderia cenocepacia]|uniref:hypothetical protein n=1 Tax=Burkholderia cenocepacia TaxID=95486 RepID=UPI001B91F86D|nr:hypothetical protein [Burkholderia cenocepacia]MBR8157143.1 hypothetical protein [Burkholderia cenocepacia]